MPPASTMTPSPSDCRARRRAVRAVLPPALLALPLTVLLVVGAVAAPPAAPPNAPPDAAPQPAAVREETFDGPEGDAPAGWRLVTFRRRDPTHYAIVRTDGRSALRSEADDAAATLMWEAAFDPHALPRLAWEWKVRGPLPGADVTRKAVEDLPARVMVLFPFDPERATWWERIAHEMARLRYGQAPPGQALVYAWGNRSPAGTWTVSTFTDRVHILAVESGAARAGTWQRATRDIAADYRARFEGPLPRRARLAVMVDTDDTDGRTVSWFDSIRLGPAEPTAAAHRPAPAGPATSGG